jgi:hypothetical protein
MARKRQDLVKGTAPHRRTERDYMGVLLNSVTLEDWRNVVDGALKAAKEGDATARAWLAQYLMGKPEAKAPTPLTVVVQQLNGADPLVERLAHSVIDRELYPSMHQNDDWKDHVKALVAAELAVKVVNTETGPMPDIAQASAD